MNKLLLTPETAAEVLSVGRTKVYQLMATGVLRSVRIGKCRRIPMAAVVELVEQLEGDTDHRQAG
jgi:excisionase family DNA binding protein